MNGENNMEKLYNKITSSDISHLMNIQTKLVEGIYEFFSMKKVHYILPVILSSETDKLQNEVLDCNISYYGQKINLMKSMILQKQLALLNESIDSIYTISPCVRLEKREKFIKGRHSIEFQQLDFEFKNKDCEYVMDFVEELIVYIFKKVVEDCGDDLKYFGRNISIPKRPFARYDNKQCLAEMGKDYEMYLSRNSNDLFWITNFDRWIYDKSIYQNGIRKNLNYDIILPEGFCELGSGGERETDKEIIISKMHDSKMDMQDHVNYLNFLDFGFVESAGIGLGIQRFLRFFTGKYDIDNVLPFERSVSNRIVL